jgi:hypothetical protein
MIDLIMTCSFALLLTAFSCMLFGVAYGIFKDARK